MTKHKPVLDMIYRNILNGWSECDHNNYDDILDPDSVNSEIKANSLEEVGYTFIDFDGNGVSELLISTPDFAANARIIEVYYIIDDTFGCLTNRISWGGYSLSLCSDHRLSADVNNIDMHIHALLRFNDGMDNCKVDEITAWLWGGYTIQGEDTWGWGCYEGQNIRLYEGEESELDIVSSKYIRKEDLTLIKTDVVPEKLDYSILKQPFKITAFSEYNA